MSEILYLLEMMNGAEGISDIEGKATRVGASERGQRVSFKTAVLFGAAALWCIPCLAKAQSADERLRAVYTEEWKWRLEQFPGLEGVTKPVPDRLPKVDPATQEMRLRYWQDVLHKLDDVSRAQLSPEEQINYDVYRPEIENFVADQKFRDHEMPANSDSAFWTDLGETARRPFKTLTDYKNWIAQIRDIPGYFREQVANMRAGLARGFTPPRLTLQGRDKSIATIAEGKPEDNLLYTPFREPMVGVQPSDQDKLKSEAARVIREIVQPAYADLLKFFRDEYVPQTRTTLAAEALPTGKRTIARKFASLPRSISRPTKFTRSACRRLPNYISRWSTRCTNPGSSASFRHSCNSSVTIRSSTPKHRRSCSIAPPGLRKYSTANRRNTLAICRACASPLNPFRPISRPFILQAVAVRAFIS